MCYCLVESILVNDGGESGNYIKDGGDDGEDDDLNIDDIWFVEEWWKDW